MGANDVANAFGTSVGSGVLTLKRAYILATIFETLGALLVGYNVTDTMRKNVLEVALYKSEPKELLVGQVAILGGCSAWLILATFAHLPVSTTHSITGATVGFGLVTRGAFGIHWNEIAAIVGSWFISPVLSGIVSSLMFMIVDFSVLRRNNPFKCGFRVLPIFYWFCIAFNAFVVSFQGSKLLHLSKLPLWICLCFSFGLATICSILIHFVMVPRLKAWIQKSVVDKPRTAFDNFDANCDDDLSYVSVAGNEDIMKSVVICEKKRQIWTTSSSSSSSVSSRTSVKTLQSTQAPTTFGSIKAFFKWLLPQRELKEDPKTMKIFSSIQILTACFAGFAHGANDVRCDYIYLRTLVSAVSINETLTLGTGKFLRQRKLDILHHDGCTSIIEFRRSASCTKFSCTIYEKSSRRAFEFSLKFQINYIVV
uniref:Phosphate transporter n=1 Tax=Parascaris univalens TaxID=6257 RepID=A0A915C6I3_PARUN